LASSLGRRREGARAYGQTVSKGLERRPCRGSRRPGPAVGQGAWGPRARRAAASAPPTEERRPDAITGPAPAAPWRFPLVISPAEVDRVDGDRRCVPHVWLPPFS